MVGDRTKNPPYRNRPDRYVKLQTAFRGTQNINRAVLNRATSLLQSTEKKYLPQTNQHRSSLYAHGLHLGIRVDVDKQYTVSIVVFTVVEEKGTSSVNLLLFLAFPSYCSLTTQNRRETTTLILYQRSRSHNSMKHNTNKAKYSIFFNEKHPYYMLR